MSTRFDGGVLKACQTTAEELVCSACLYAGLAARFRLLARHYRTKELEAGPRWVKHWAAKAKYAEQRVIYHEQQLQLSKGGPRACSRWATHKGQEAANASKG